LEGEKKIIYIYIYIIEERFEVRLDSGGSRAVKSVARNNQRDSEQ